jgi:hypothetical protein
VLARGHETFLEGPEEQGARRGGPRNELGGGGEDLLGLGADHQALYLKRRRETGGVDAMPIAGRPRVKGAALEGWLPGHLRENPDLTLEEHREAFEEQSAGSRSRLRAWGGRSPGCPAAGRSKSPR